MAAILEIPEVRERLSPLTVEEYHRLGEYNEHGRRTELIRGFVIEKMSKSPLHRTVCSLLYRILSQQLQKGYAVWKEEPLTFSDSEPEPDISVTKGSEETFKQRHPATAELVIEVAVSSPALDRANAALYAEAGVKEYWIVLCATRQIEVYRRPIAGEYQEKEIFNQGQELSLAGLPLVTIPIADLFQ